MPKTLIAKTQSALSMLALVVKRIIGLCALFIAAAICYWDIQRPIPVPPTITPAANAYDDFVRAGQLTMDREKIGYAVSDRHYGGVHKDDRPYTIQEKAAMLRENQRALSQLREGLAHPCASPLSRTIHAGFDKYQGFALLRFLLTLEAQVKLASSDNAGAMESNLDMAKYGVVLSTDHTPIDTERGQVSQRISFRRSWDIMHSLTKGEAANAASRLEQMDGMSPSYTSVLQESKWAGLTVMNQMADQWPGYRNPIDRAHLKMNTRRFSEDMDHRIQESRRPWSGDIDHYPHKLTIFNDLALIFEPVDDDAYDFYHTDTNRRLLMTALALQAFHGDTKTYPASLAKLTPHYLSSVPRNPFSPSRAILQYKRTGAAFLLYSIGPDAKDNGGQSIIRRTPDKMTRYQRYSVSSDSVGDIVAGVNE